MVGNRLWGPGLYCFTSSSRQKKKVSPSLVALVSPPAEACTCAKTPRHKKTNCARACVKGSIPRGVARRAKCEPSKLLRPCKLTMDRVGQSDCCFSCCVTAKQNSSAWIVCQTGLRALRCVSVCLVHCKYLNFCLFDGTPTVSSRTILDLFFILLFQISQTSSCFSPWSDHMESAVVPEHIV